MADKIIRGIARNGNIRFFVAKTTDLVEKARELHYTYPAASAALGRLMSVSAIMALNLKGDDEKLVVEIRGDNELKHMLVDADRNGSIRSIISHPHVHQVNEATGKLDVGGIIGEGFLSVSYKLNGATTFSSQIELQTGEIGDDFAYYYAQSEQIPSALSVGVLVNEDITIKSAGAILVQVMPNATEEDIVAIEDLFARLAPVSTIMIDHEALEVATTLFDDAVILDSVDLKYHCGCNRDQMRDVLNTLNDDELQQLIDEDNGATIICQYCGKQYAFSAEELGEIINARKTN